MPPFESAGHMGQPLEGHADSFEEALEKARAVGNLYAVECAEFHYEEPEKIP